MAVNRLSLNQIVAKPYEALSRILFEGTSVPPIRLVIVKT